MNVPNLLIAESKKTSTWIGDVAIAYSQMASTTSDKVDKECWEWYHNIFDEAQFEYLTKDGANEYPAQMKHIPIQKHYLDLLVSQQARRPFMFSVYLADKESLKKKKKKKLMAIVKEYDVRMKQKHYNSITSIQNIEQQMQRIQQMLGEQPQSEEQAQQQEQLRQALPGIQNQFNYLTDVIKTEDVLTKKNIKKIEQYYRYNYKDFEEELAQKITLKGRKELEMEYKSTQNFVSNLVTGKEYYFVDYEEGDSMPSFDILKSSLVRYPAISNLDFVEDGPWVMIEEGTSVSQIIDEHGAEIVKKYGEEKLREISKGHFAGDNAVYVSTPEDGAILENERSLTGTIDDSQNIKKQTVYFKVPREIKIKKSPNKYSGGEFTNFANPLKEIIKKEDYTYSKSIYTNKTNKKKSYKKEDVETYSAGKGEKIVKKYTQDLYQAVILNGDIVVDTKKKEVLRSVDKHSKIKLPVFGKAFNSITDRPYSLIWATRGLQKLYNIVYYHKELMLALAGTKGQTVDISQKPPDMLLSDWNYEKKLGNLYIQTTDENGRPQGSGFNQWQSYDNTLSPSIQFLSGLLHDIEDTIGRIVGIPPQRAGEVVASDQVGTTESSIRQSSLITEIIYENHDVIEGRALSHWVNLMARNCLDKHDVMDLDDGLYGEGVFEIPKDVLRDVDLNCIMQNNTSEENKLKDMKSIYMNYASKSQEPFENILSVYNEDSVKALQKKLEYFGELTQEARESSAQQAGQAEMAKDTNRIKLEQEFKAMVEEQKNKIENIKVQLTKENQDAQNALKQTELAQKAEEHEDLKQLKLLELANEQISETAVLEENRRSSMVDEKLRSLQTTLSALELELSKTQQADTHQENTDKIKVEDKKANKMVKEKVSDRN